MLVLTRNPNQSIVIGHDVVVTVLEIRGEQVRLGIRAPRHVEVHREEVYAALQNANKSAVTSTAKAAEKLGKVPRPPKPPPPPPPKPPSD